jgi:hypothetical protein
MFRYRESWPAVLLLGLRVFLTDAEAADFLTLQKSSWFLVVCGASLRWKCCPAVQTEKIAMGRESISPIPTPAERPAAVEELVRGQKKGALLSAIAWIVGNAAVFLVLKLLRLFTSETMVLLLLVYTVCDVICILFFCPFQRFFLKNRCCTVCRIYNWDSIMITTPLILFPSPYSVSLVLLSLAVLLRWELAYDKNPHFFFEETNGNLACQSCTDRLCTVRKPLGGRGTPAGRQA